jgi:hypothetical protein
MATMRLHIYVVNELEDKSAEPKKTNSFWRISIIQP